MKILTHDSHKGIGGINRRLRALQEHSRTYGDIDVVAVGINKLDRVELPLDPYSGLSSAEEAYKRFFCVVEELLPVINEQKPDVVLVAGTHYLPWSLMHAAKAANVPVVHVHAGIMQDELDNLVAARSYFQLEQEFGTMPAHTIFNSEAAKNRVRQIFGVIPTNTVIWNGVPHKFFIDDTTQRSGIVHVARADQYKTPDFYIDVLAKINDRLPTLSSQYVSNIQPDHPSYDRLIASGCTLIPQTTDESLLTILSQIRIFVSSNCFETFGNSGLEALAAGATPIIANHTGFAEMLRHYALDDLLFNPADINEAADKIVKYDRSKWKLPADVRRDLLSTRTWESVAAQYVRCFEEL